MSNSSKHIIVQGKVCGNISLFDNDLLPRYITLNHQMYPCKGRHIVGVRYGVASTRMKFDQQQLDISSSTLAEVIALSELGGEWWVTELEPFLSLGATPRWSVSLKSFREEECTNDIYVILLAGTIEQAGVRFSSANWKLWLAFVDWLLEFECLVNALHFLLMPISAKRRECPGKVPPYVKLKEPLQLKLNNVRLPFWPNLLSSLQCWNQHSVCIIFIIVWSEITCMSVARHIHIEQKVIEVTGQSTILTVMEACVSEYVRRVVIHTPGNICLFDWEIPLYVDWEIPDHFDCDAWLNIPPCTCSSFVVWQHRGWQAVVVRMQGDCQG